MSTGDQDYSMPLVADGRLTATIGTEGVLPPLEPQPPRDETPVCRYCAYTLTYTLPKTGHAVCRRCGAEMVARWRREKAQRILDGLED